MSQGGCGFFWESQECQVGYSRMDPRSCRKAHKDAPPAVYNAPEQIATDRQFDIILGTQWIRFR